MNSGRILHEQASDDPAGAGLAHQDDDPLCPLLLFARGAVTPDSELVVTPYAASQVADQARPEAGCDHRAADAVNALVTLSANDAAVTIAENLAGTEENFARVMTRRRRSSA